MLSRAPVFMCCTPVVVPRGISQVVFSLPTLKKPITLHHQELRVEEYVSLSDYATAVGHLLASAPDTSARYYRDALVTLALASAAAHQAPAAPGLSQLRTQAAKVITANAATVGDSALGVPLLCSIGMAGCC